MTSSRSQGKRRTCRRTLDCWRKKINSSPSACVERTSQERSSKSNAAYGMCSADNRRAENILLINHIYIIDLLVTRFFQVRGNKFETLVDLSVEVQNICATLKASKLEHVAIHGPDDLGYTQISCNGL